MDEKASLVLVGSGIKTISHLTVEATAYIKSAEKLLYLVNEPLLKEWFHQNNQNAESLDTLYYSRESRVESYRAITDYILETLGKYQSVTVVLYGHPTVFAKPGLAAAITARSNGCDVKILPGISSEDCLFADLSIDPGVLGCQSFEATDFLVHKRKFDTTSHLILWQVGFIGVLNHLEGHDNSSGIRVLKKYLLSYYDENHTVILYEASQYPAFEPSIQEAPLGQLSDATTSPMTTLYVPPFKKAMLHQDMLTELGIKMPI